MENPSTIDTNLLKHAVESGIIDLACIIEQSDKLRRKEILKQYSYWYNAKQDRWYWYEPDITRPEGRKPIKRKEKGDLEQHIVEYHLANTDLDLKSSPTVREVFDDYFKSTKKDKSILISTLNRYRNYFNKYIGTNKLADLKIINVTEKDIKKLLDGIVKGKSGDERITKKVFNEI